MEGTTKHDTAPLRRIFGPLAPRVARLIAIQPGLARRLLCAPARAVHVAGAYLHLIPPGPDEELARFLDEADPRDLMREVFPDAPPRLYRALDRLGDAVCSADMYHRVEVAATGPFAEVLLTSSGAIDDRLLRHVEGLAASGEAVHLLPARVLADPAAADAVASVLALLRSHGLDPAEVLASLPAGARLTSVERRLVEALSTISAPPPTVAVPPGFHHLATVGELRRVGREMKLCVAGPLHHGAQHWLRLINGHSAYLICTEPTTLIEVQRVSPDMWRIGEARREANRMVNSSLKRVIIAKLRDAGWRLIETDPAEALVVIASRTDDEFEQWDRSLGAMLAEMEHEWA